MVAATVDAQKVGARDRLHAESHGGRATAFIERGILRDVLGRQMQRQVEHLQADVVGEAELVDRGASCGGEFHRARGRLHGLRRDAVPRDPVIAGEDRHQRPVDGGRPPAPACQPCGKLLQPAKRFPRLLGPGELRAHPLSRSFVSRRQAAHEVAEIVEGQCAGHVVKVRGNGRWQGHSRDDGVAQWASCFLMGLALKPRLSHLEITNGKAS